MWDRGCRPTHVKGGGRIQGDIIYVCAFYICISNSDNQVWPAGSSTGLAGLAPWRPRRRRRVSERAKIPKLPAPSVGKGRVS